MDGNELVRALGALGEDLGPYWDLAFLVAYIIGLCGVIAGFFIIWQSSGQHGGGHLGAGLAAVIVGVLLLGLESILDAGSQTLFQEDAPKNLSAVNFGSSADAAFLTFAVRVTMLVGLCGIIKGLTMFKHIGEGSGGSKYNAATFFFAGIICINIVTFTKAFGNTVGGVLQDVITRLFGG